jgi:tRNA threonylcarbamoyladenosine biosynthesis protein TsaE
MRAQVARKDKHDRTVRIVRSGSPEETRQLGRKLAGSLRVPAVVLLCGSLGTGKTTMTRGLAEGLGLADPALVHSPSFTIVNVYRGRYPIYHVDLYRLRGERDLNSIGLEDFMGREGVTIVEWGERLSYAGEVALVVELEDAGGDSRILHIHAPGRRARKKVR